MYWHGEAVVSRMFKSVRDKLRAFGPFLIRRFLMRYSSKDVEKLLKAMEQVITPFPPPMSALIIHDYGRDPYLILISCLLSLRSRDPVTYSVSKELFSVAQTPQEMLKIPLEQLEKIIRPIGFYRRKAMILQEVSRDLIDHFKGKVPKTEAELLSIKHIGRKTANLVLSMAFDKPALCVDTHVHRIANHMGLVHTKTPEATEIALKKIVPQAWWGRLNHIFVVWGQNVCKPASKRCSCTGLIKKALLS